MMHNSFIEIKWHEVLKTITDKTQSATGSRNCLMGVAIKIQIRVNQIHKFFSLSVEAIMVELEHNIIIMMTGSRRRSNLKITTLCFIKINTPCNRSFEQLVYILLKDLDVHNCSRKFNVIDKLAFNNAGNIINKII